MRVDRWRAAVVLLIVLSGLAGLTRGQQGDPTAPTPADQLRDHTPRAYALTNARIVTGVPDKADKAKSAVIERGTIVVRDGVIEAVGADVDTPGDVRVIDLEGRTVYPGFIDAFTEVELSPPTDGARYWNDRVTPELRVADHYKVDRAVNAKLRGQGIVARLAAPSRGIIKGVSAVVTTGDEPAGAIVKREAGLHVQLVSAHGGSREQYPNSPMGVVALARQAMYDADWHAQASAAARRDGTAPPPGNDALSALADLRRRKLPVVIDAPHELALLRADLFADEFKLNMIARGSGREYRRLAEVLATRRPIIVPVNFAQAPNVATPEAAMEVSLARLMHWDHAPENPGRVAAKAGGRMALTAHGLSDAGQFLSQVRKAVKRGLDEQVALRSLTTVPAKLLGVHDRFGTIEAGRSASFVVTDGQLFDDKTKVVETWVAGVRHELKSEPVVDPRGEWKATLLRPGEGPGSVKLLIEGEAAKLKGRFVLPAPQKAEGEEAEKSDEKPQADEKSAEEKDAGKEEAKPAVAAEPKTVDVSLDKLSLDGARLTATFKSKAFDQPGVATLGLTFTANAAGQSVAMGQVAWPDGRVGWCTAKLAVGVPAEHGDGPWVAGEKKKDEAKKDDEKQPRQALFAVNYPLGAFGREKAPAAGNSVFTNATIWTAGLAGVIDRGYVWIRDGKIVEVGKGSPRAGSAGLGEAEVIDATGLHITPGLIDCHSHIATDGGINESAQAVTAEVRIGDFVDCDDIAIYRQLAGGTTSANILHGSANPIGGQNQVVKFRWGSAPQAMKFAEAPAGIKFALGENVKQSNWGDRYTTRFPQTRMGVEQIMRDEFAAARAYVAERKRWEEADEKGRGAPPRWDLELDAVAQILAGERWIHCHSYRQDEILALIRVCDDFGVKIGTFQHVLEGYKVADAIAKHGAMGSSFSDWWAYKLEVYDAVPYNGALMHEAGVNVSFNSDSAELGRRLNTEAAKAVKYGGVKPEEALKFVTLNPAKQLRIDQWVGSLEPGKHADLAIWSGPPLSSLSRCEQTWVDGRKYFDRKEDAAAQQRVREMRAALIQRILDSGEEMLKAGEGDDNGSDILRVNIFCSHCQQMPMGRGAEGGER